MGIKEKLNLARKIVTEAVPTVIGTCSGVAASMLVTSNIKTPGKLYLKLAVKVGVFGITYAVEKAVTSVFERDVNELFDAIEEAVETKEMRDSLTNDEVRITFDTEGIASTVAEKAEEKASKDGFVTFAYILAMFDDGQVTAILDKDKVAGLGWRDGFSWTVEKHETDTGEAWTLTLPPCEVLR